MREMKERKNVNGERGRIYRRRKKNSVIEQREREQGDKLKETPTKCRLKEAPFKERKQKEAPFR